MVNASDCAKQSWHLPGNLALQFMKQDRARLAQDHHPMATNAEKGKHSIITPDEQELAPSHMPKYAIFHLQYNNRREQIAA